MQIDTVTLAAADLAAQREFYGGVLGLAELPAAEGIAFQAGRSRLAFRPSDGAAARAHIAFAAPAGSFAMAREWVAARAPLLADRAGVTSFDQAGWDADSVYFADPAGHILEVIARRGAAGPAPEVLSICEVGIVVPDVGAAVARLGAELGIAAFRQPGDELFAALGDAEGLLIVVRRGREWFPSTGVAAEIAVERAGVRTARGAFRLAAPGYAVAPVG